jgi:tRNA (cmo5U34)-methyltransferase
MFKLRGLPLLPFYVVRELITQDRRVRVPEAMVMDERDGVAEYDQLGEMVQVPMHQFNALSISRILPEGGTVLDLGCGSCRLLARLAQGRPDAHIIGLDLSEPMLEAGRSLLARYGLAGQVELRRADITMLDTVTSRRPNVVCCNFALHQLPTDELLQQCLRAIRRMRESTGCGIHIFDIARLRHPGTFPALLSLVNMPGDLVLDDAIASERAAFTFAELNVALERAGLTELRHVRSRPLGEYQLHWVADRQSVRPGLWHDTMLPEGTRLATRVVRRSFPRGLTSHKSVTSYVAERVALRGAR